MLICTRYRALRSSLRFIIIAVSLLGPVAQSATVTWKTATSGNWNDGSKWSSGAPPAIGDVVVIDLPGTYQVTVNAVTDLVSLNLGNPIGKQTLVIGPGSSLKLSVAGSITNGGALHLAPGGTLDGTGVLTIHGQFEWQGGAMAGSGKTLFAPGSVIQVINGDNKTLRDRTVDNATTVQWNATHALSVGGGTVWNNLPGSVLDFKADASIQFWFGAGGVLNNHGTIRKSGGIGTASIGYALHNSGTVQASSGTMNLTAGGTVGGNWIADTSASILWSSGIYVNAVGSS